MPFRFDAVTIDGKPTRDQFGFLRVDARATRSGVFRYRSLDGKDRFELRADSEVFNNGSLDTLKMVPVTNDHPIVGLVTSDNAKALQVGFTGENIKRDKPFVGLPIVVTDKVAVDDVEGGKRELSCGYHCDVVEESGTYNGEKYTHVQRNIRYNHVAIVDKGRAGPQVKLKMDQLRIDGENDVAYMVDSEDEICPDCKKKKSECTCKTDCNAGKNKSKKSPMRKDRKMSIKKINGIEYEGAQEIINYCDSLETQISALTKDKATLEADRDAQKARADKAETEVKALPQKIADAATARRNLEATASKVLPKETKIDSMTDAQIRTAVIAARFPEIKLDGKSEEYVSALFDSALAVQPVDPARVNNSILAGSQAGGARQDQHVDADVDPMEVRRGMR